MKKRKQTFKQKIIKIIATSLIAQFVLLIGADLASPSLSAKLINIYADITFMEPSTIKQAISSITDPVRATIQNFKREVLN